MLMMTTMYWTAVNTAKRVIFIIGCVGPNNAVDVRKVTEMLSIVSYLKS